jgi:integrase/recombinase XerD
MDTNVSGANRAAIPFGAEDVWMPLGLWLATCNSLNTRSSYMHVLRGFARGAGPNPGDWNEAMVLDYKADLVNRGLSARTVRHHLCALRSFFEWAIERGYHPGPNPAGRIPMPPRQWNIAGVALSIDELSALLGKARTTRDRALLHVLARGGLRASEMAALLTRDVHFHLDSPEYRAATITVRLAKGGLLRQVDLSRPAAEDLQIYLATGERRSGPMAPVFQHLDGQGRPLSYHSVYRIVRDCAARAGLGHITPHDLRRTYATLQLDGGATLPYVQRQMGHELMIQTVRYYRHAR